MQWCQQTDSALCLCSLICVCLLNRLCSASFRSTLKPWSNSAHLHIRAQPQFSDYTGRILDLVIAKCKCILRVIVNGQIPYVSVFSLFSNSAVLMFDLLEFEMKQWPMWSFYQTTADHWAALSEQQGDTFLASGHFPITSLFLQFLVLLLFCFFFNDLDEYHAPFSTSFLTVVLIVAKGPSGAAGWWPGLELE